MTAAGVGRLAPARELRRQSQQKRPTLAGVRRDERREAIDVRAHGRGEVGGNRSSRCGGINDQPQAVRRGDLVQELLGRPASQRADDLADDRPIEPEVRDELGFGQRPAGSDRHAILQQGSERGCEPRDGRLKAIGLEAV